MTIDETTRTFSQLARDRRSFRHFEPTPVDRAIITAALEDASYAPSNCNTQPWRVHIVSGASKDRLSAALLRDRERGGESYDFTFDTTDYPEEFVPLIRENGRSIYEPQGIARDDAEGRRRAASRNLEFYGAPHVALFHMPPVGDNVRVAADLGMFMQTFLLSLTERGVGSIPQTSIARHADTVREVLSLRETELLLCAVSFGYPVKTAPVNLERSSRTGVAEFALFYD